MSRRGAEAFTASESATSFAFHIEIDLLFVWMASKMKEFALLILFAADRLDLLRFGMDGIHAVGGRPPWKWIFCLIFESKQTAGAAADSPASSNL